MVGHKLSEMMAFISASPDVVLCSACTAKAASEAQSRRNRQRERIMQQMELRPTAPVDSDQPALYSRTKSQRRESKAKADKEKEKEVVETVKPVPRRAFSTREKATSSRYSSYLDRLRLNCVELMWDDIFLWEIDFQRWVTLYVHGNVSGKRNDISMVLPGCN